VLPHDLLYKQTTVGGLSGIDYDPVTKTWYLICDNSSNGQAARFYTAKIELSEDKIQRVTLSGIKTLKQQKGVVKSTAQHKTSDPEAIRYHSINKTLVWSSEGQRVVNDSVTRLIDPTIQFMSKNGKYLDSIPLPDNLRMKITESGPRQNGVLEGLTFDDNFKSLYASLEEPLYQDGPRADLVRNNAFVRIYKFDMISHKNTAQFAYELEPIPFPLVKTEGSMNNGISDLMSIGQQRFLVIERAYSAGRVGANIKIFIAELAGADNIIELPSLRKTPVKNPVKKTLLLNMDEAGIFVDNVEGATIGPVLPNGHQTLMFVTDNNFSAKEQTQFLLFEVIP